MLFENFKNYYILRYDIYDFFKNSFRGALTDLFG